MLTRVIDNISVYRFFWRSVYEKKMLQCKQRVFFVHREVGLTQLRGKETDR